MIKQLLALATKSTLLLLLFPSPLQANGSTEIIVTSLEYSCVLQANSKVNCWGRFPPPPPTIPINTDTQFRSITAGTGHVCGLRLDNTLECFGRNRQLQSIPPTGEFKQVSGGAQFTCALRTDNTLTCWGINDKEQLNAPPGEFIEITTGRWHACARRADNTAICWGSNETNFPTAQKGQAIVPEGKLFKQISAGQWHTCGLLLNNKPLCWGNGTNGFGDGQSTPPDWEFKRLSAGGNHTCGLRLDNTIACWGWNRQGQVRMPNAICPNCEADKGCLCHSSPNDTYLEISAGSSEATQTCAIRSDHSITCWGLNDNGEATVPDCTTARAVQPNALQLTATTPTLQTHPAQFSGTIKTQNNTGCSGRKAIITSTETDEITIETYYTPTNDDLQKLAARVVAAQFTPPQSQQTQWFIRNPDNTWQNWQITNTQTLLNATTSQYQPLQTIENELIYKGNPTNIPNGTWIIYIGYLLTDGTLIFNGQAPIELTLQ